MYRLAQKIIHRAKSRVRRLIIRVADLVLPHLPVRVVLSIVMLAQALRLPGQSTLLLHLISAMAAREKHKPDLPLLRGKNGMPVASSHTLHALGRHQDAIKAIMELKPGARRSANTLLMAR